jgi:hypothetical protein
MDMTGFVMGACAVIEMFRVSRHESIETIVRNVEKAAVCAVVA